MLETCSFRSENAGECKEQEWRDADRETQASETMLDIKCQDTASSLCQTWISYKIRDNGPSTSTP